MPILSDAPDPIYPPDDRFIPTPEQPTSPDYGFSFDAPSGYARHFNFDRCPRPSDGVSANPFSGTPKIPPPKLDFNDQNLFYRRLFRLADTNGKPRFYLCPWLIVPFEEKSTDKFVVTIKNDLNTNSVRLMVRPFLKSQPDSVQPATTPAAARTFIKGLAPAHLKLGTTDTRVHAKWTETGSDVIDESRCTDLQKFEITFNESTTSYPYSCDLTITSDQVGLVGQLCLVFVKMLEIPTILFNISIDTLHTLEITQLEQAEANTKLNGPNPNQKTGLNGILERCGLRFVSSPSQVKRKGETNPISPGTPILFPFVDEILKKDPDQPAEITTAFLKTIETIDGTSVNFGDRGWRQGQSPYLFVFFMSYVELKELDVQMRPVGETAGFADFFERTAHIFDSTPRVMAHECGHAFGLQHIFYSKEKNEAAVHAAFEDATRTTDEINITTQSELYSLYDDANKRGLAEALTTQTPDDNPSKGTRLGTSLNLRSLLSPRRYIWVSTDNLMDYITTGEMSSKESVRKDQVERIRRFA